MQQTLNPEMDPQAFGNLSGASVSENSCHVPCAEWFVMEGSLLYSNRMWLTTKLLFLLFRSLIFLVYLKGWSRQEDIFCSQESSLLLLMCPDAPFCPSWPEFLHGYFTPSGKWQASHQYTLVVILVIKCCNKDSTKPHCVFRFCMVIFCNVTIFL
jgi:hypothetical protein